MCSPAPRYLFTHRTARGQRVSGLITSDLSLAARWLVRRFEVAGTGDELALMVNGVDRGARIAARLMSLSQHAVAESIRAETTRMETKAAA